ncbi:MAG: 30S ribosome-binding factor RbfA [Chitinispirillaceae bacterium]|nr:30S ribosome-binding factor RbfA [Chitinispirillaceae bacterium]
MPSSQYHIQRLAEQLRQEIGTVIAREMRDPRIPPVVTVTHVKLSQDTRNATVHISIYGEENVRKNAFEVINAAAAYIQRIVARRVTMKHFPQLCFKRDDSIEYSSHINELLKEIQNDLEQS